MDVGAQRSAQCSDHCRDFQIMLSPDFPNTLILRWTTINIEEIDRPQQCYRYECFNTDGSPRNCSIHYSTPPAANHFYEHLELLYHQSFAIDHKR